MDKKELIRGGYEDGRGGKRESWSDAGRRAAQPDCASESTRWLRGESRLRTPACGPFPLWDFKTRRPISRSAHLGSRPVLRSPSYRLNPSGFSEGAAVDEVLPPSGLVADMVVGVCLESVHYHECQHACFNQEPSSIPNTALLNGKTFQHFNHCCFLLFSAA